MNRFKLCSGGLAASLMVLVAASAAAQAPGEWTMTGRTYDLQRYSPLASINRANVKNLVAKWTFSTGVLNGHEGNPLVIGNVMYVHSADHQGIDRKSTRLNSSHLVISYAVFCLKKKKVMYVHSADQQGIDRKST